MTTAVDLSRGDIQGLCQRFLDDKPQEVSNQLGFKVLNWSAKPMSDAPAGFLGRHQLLCVEIQRQVSEPDSLMVQKIEKLHFFIKSAPTDVASSWEYLEEFGVFKKEIQVYREVLPTLQQYFACIAPKCYFADHNMLVFENLALQGYRMAAERDGLLNYEHLNCALKTLANMHASSIVYEVREGKKLHEQYSEAVTENSYPLGIGDMHVRSQNFNNGVKVFCEMIKLMPKYKDHMTTILEELPRQMREIFRLAQQSTKYQNVFSHGDLWANNVMFRYGKFGEIPIECRFVDFQLARYAPAMVDLVTLLTIPSSRSFRERYMHDLVCDYYTFMSEFLRREQLNIENFMPRVEFFASIEEFRIVGLIESCLFSHLTILPEQSTRNLTGSTDGFSDFFARKRVEICMDAFVTDTVYRERLTDMLEDFVDNFVLKCNNSENR